jgi:hypothetical protein
LGGEVGERAGNSDLSGNSAEDIIVDLIEHFHFWQRLAAGGGQFQPIWVEVDLHVRR